MAWFFGVYKSHRTVSDQLTFGGRILLRDGQRTSRESGNWTGGILGECHTISFLGKDGRGSAIHMEHFLVRLSKTVL